MFKLNHVLDKQNEIIIKIVQAVFEALPTEKYIKFDVEVSILNKMIEQDAKYYINDNESVSFNANSNGINISMLFKELRESNYLNDPQKGPWYYSKIEVDENGKFNIFFNYDSEPNFKYTPSDDKFIDDFKKFPRDKEFVPEWLSIILKRNNAQ
jgi:Protein of unknown function, DUF600